MPDHILLSNGVPTATPTALGQHCIDTTNKIHYNSVGTATSADWKQSSAPTLATVATSGSYTDLINKPTIPSSTSQLTNDSSFVVGPLTKSSVGLSNVQNVDQTNPSNISQDSTHRFVTDSEKGVWNGKENQITSGLSTQYWRGDKTWQTHDKTSVGLGNVANIDTTIASNITQDSTHRFTTDVEKASWNAKATASDISTAINNLVNSAPGTLDTLNEIATALGNDPNFASSMTTQLAGKAATVHSHAISDVTSLQTSLNGKENSITSGTSGQVWSGLKTWITLTASYISDFAAQAIVAAKTNLTNTPPPLTNITDAAHQGTSTEFARQDHKHAFNVTGVTPGTYGDLDSVGMFTVNSQGQITAASTVGIADATTSVHGLMSATDKTKLDGIINDTALFTTADITQNSNVTLSNLSDLTINMTSGHRYYINYWIVYNSSASATGISFALTGSATQTFIANLRGNTTTTASTLSCLNALNSVLTFSATPFSGSGLNLIEVEAVVYCTGNGTFIPQFRSEVNGSTITVKSGAACFYREV